MRCPRWVSFGFEESSSSNPLQPFHLRRREYLNTVFSYLPYISMADMKDDIVNLASKPSTPFQSFQPDAAQLVDRLSSLQCEPTTPPRIIETSNLSHNRENSRGFHINGSHSDSGYVSLVSTPQQKTRPLLLNSPLEIFNKPVAEYFRNRFMDIKVLYTETLWKAVSGKRKKSPGDISMKLKYMGESEVEARLYIVVQCERRRTKARPRGS